MKVVLFLLVSLSLVACEKSEQPSPEAPTVEPAIAKPVVNKTEKIQIDLTAPTTQRWKVDVTGFDITALHGRVLVPRKADEPGMAAFSGTAGMMRVDLGTPFKAGTYDPANFLVTNAVTKAQCGYSSVSGKKTFEIKVVEEGEKFKATFEGEVMCHQPDNDTRTPATVKGHFEI